MIDTRVGRELLHDIGFLLVPGSPFAPAPAYLIVGLRAAPTFEHFDADRIDYWQTVDGRGRAASLDWPTRVPAVGDFAWGEIRIVDRLNVRNEFVTFGGHLQVSVVDGIKVCVFSSEAPIVARGGHSQAWEAGAQEVVAFLGRLRAAADPRISFERRAAALSPVALYSSFVWDSMRRTAATEHHASWTHGDPLELVHERRRLHDNFAQEWQAGGDLPHGIQANAIRPWRTRRRAACRRDCVAVHRGLSPCRASSLA